MFCGALQAGYVWRCLLYDKSTSSASAGWPWHSHWRYMGWLRKLMLLHHMWLLVGLWNCSKWVELCDDNLSLETLWCREKA